MRKEIKSGDLIRICYNGGNGWRAHLSAFAYSVQKVYKDGTVFAHGYGKVKSWVRQ